MFFTLSELFLIYGIKEITVQNTVHIKIINIHMPKLHTGSVYKRDLEFI